MRNVFATRFATRAGALVLMLFVVFTVAGNGSAQEFGARALSMAGAYTAAANDISSLIYNPAGLTENSFEIALGVGSASLNELQNFQSILANEFEEDVTLDLVTLGGVSLGRFGAGVAADGIVEARLDCEDGAYRCGQAKYMIQFLAGGGIDLGRLPLGLADLKAGISVGRLDGRRITHSRVEASADTYHGRTDDLRGKGYTLNFGVTFKATDVVTLGLAAQNVASNVTWSGTSTTGVYRKNDDTAVGPETKSPVAEYSEKLPSVYRAGVAIRPPVLSATIAADVASDGTVRVGVEKGLLANALILRAGYAAGKDEQLTTAGLGIVIGPVHLDLAVGSPDGFKTTKTLVEGSVRF